MTERDAFEVRFGAAVRGYAGGVTSDLDPVEFARRIAAREPRRRGLVAALGRPLTAPRGSWVLLLIAALLTALVASMIVIGSQPIRQLPALVPPVDQLFTCPPGTNPDEPGPVGHARPRGWADLAFDRRSGRVVDLASPDDASPLETWTFDVCTNTWARMHPNQEPPPGTGGLVYDVDSDLTVAPHGTRVWAYDLKTNTWTKKAATAIPDTTLWFYDPFSGQVVGARDDGNDDTLGFELSSYDVETDTWTPIRQTNRLAVGPHYEFFAYDASVDRVVAYVNGWKSAGDGAWLFGARTWLLDIRTGTWSGPGALAPQFSAGMWGHVPAIAFDGAAQRTVVLGQGHSAAYDAIADSWETLYQSASEDPLAECPARPECRQLHYMVYDPVNERLVIYGGFVAISGGTVDPDDVLAFDTRTRAWTVLLAPSDGRTVALPN